jgi:hypothetical protein
LHLRTGKLSIPAISPVTPGKAPGRMHPAEYPNVLALTPILFSRDFRREIGETLIHVGEKLTGNRDVQPIAPSSMQAQTSNPNSESAPSAANTNPTTRTNANSEQSDAASYTQANRRTVSSADSHLAPQQHIADAHSRRGRSALARQLWSAIGAGDYSAEVALAQLYLTGDGVPRSCEQARVLLRAASKTGSTEPLQELRKLGYRACR